MTNNYIPIIVIIAVLLALMITSLFESSSNSLDEFCKNTYGYDSDYRLIGTQVGECYNIEDNYINIVPTKIINGKWMAVK